MARPQDRKFVTADLQKCVGCQVCEYACSMANEKTFNPSKSRIRTMRIKPMVSLAVTCRHCEDPPCVSACPRNALTQEARTGIIRVDEKACNGCGWCISSCTFGAINMHPDKKVVFTCNNCTDNEAKTPQCVKWCPEGALTLVSAETLAQRVRHGAVRSLLENYNNKRK